MKHPRNERLIVMMATLSAIMVLALGTSAPGAEPAARYGGTLRISEMNEASSPGYPPKMARVTNTLRQATPAVERLLGCDRTGKPIPWLATGIRENAPARNVTLALRKGVKFHDGTDFNSQAVKWNFEQSMSAKSQGSDKFKSVDLVDTSTVRINLTEWDSTVTSNLTQALGVMISPTAYKKNGEEWCMSHPVGTGPFEFASWEKDVRITYKRFNGYWQKGKPYLDGVVWRPIVDHLTRLLSFKTGELDIILNVGAKDSAGLEKDGYVVTRVRPGSGAYAIIPNSVDPKSPFADVRVRRAAQHAVDTEAIVKGVMHGEAEAANQFVYKGHWGYNPSVSGYPYDPSRAKQLLAEAGYPNGFKTRLIYRTNPEWDQVFTAVQGYLRAVGIDVELQPSASARYDQIAFQGGKWEGFIQNAISANSDVTALMSIRYAGGPNFYTSMLAPEDYVRALENSLTAPDFSTKQKYAREVMRLMTEKYCLQIMLYCPSEIVASKAYVHRHGFYETPDCGTWTPADAWKEK